ncbi:MAG: glycosyltransferase, partial [bacterium]
TPNIAQHEDLNVSNSILKTHTISQPYLFYPAQFWPHKNHIIILYAVKFLKEQHNLNFSVVFTGSDKGNLEYIKEQASKLGLENNVHFLGFVTMQELVALYRHAFALVFASFFGPNNIPPLEAFSLGCPVIAANVAGAQEQLGTAALFFDPKNYTECAKHVMQLVHKQNLRTILIAKGIQRAQQWTTKDYLEKLVSIIDDFEPIRRCWSSNKPYIHS